ncbi:MAG TPA: adenine phosphoribosyltransferase [Eubacteriales bacterium]|nr:adenine phosphoribosyltransferase [Eubacteriales bacterium]
MDLREKIRSIPDFPIKGVLFRDITTLLKDKEGYSALINTIADSLRDRQVDLVIGPEARGFVIGSALAYALHAGFVLARKPGKLPCETMRYEYGLEYGADVLEIHKDAIQPGQKVVIVDDLLATGGTALATVKLVEQAGGEVVGVRFAIELSSEFDGRKMLEGYDVQSVMQY